MYPAKKQKAAKKVTMSAPGKKPLTFNKGSLHAQLGVAAGTTIPAAKLAAAKAGKYGPLAKKRAMFATNVLSKGRKTARKKA